MRQYIKIRILSFASVRSRIAHQHSLAWIHSFHSFRGKKFFADVLNKIILNLKVSKLTKLRWWPSANLRIKLLHWSRIMHSDWVKFITWLSISNQSVLLRSRAINYSEIFFWVWLSQLHLKKTVVKNILFPYIRFIHLWRCTLWQEKSFPN